MVVNRLAQHPSRRPLGGVAFLVTARPPRNRTRLEALRRAMDGLREAWRTQPNVRLHALAAALAVILGAWCRLSTVEWLWIGFAIGLVAFAELMNTAIERTVDLIVGLRPDPLARAVKDIAAASVLIAALIGAFIGAFTFLPRLLNR